MCTVANLYCTRKLVRQSCRGQRVGPYGGACQYAVKGAWWKLLFGERRDKTSLEARTTALHQGPEVFTYSRRDRSGCCSIVDRFRGELGVLGRRKALVSAVSLCTL